MALYTVKGGAFVSLMPKSILISSLTMLKTWWELVQDARQAGISVAKKGLQLWNVGAGLPLDAIKKGSISWWKCQYEVSDQEVVSLIDALGKNKSLTRLDLSLARLEWMTPVKREQRSALSLLRLMNTNTKALESLDRLIISSAASKQPAEGLFSGFAALYASLSALGSTETEADLKKLFDEIDEDGSGTLEVEELQKVFQTKLNIRKTDEEIKKVFEEIKGGLRMPARLPACSCYQR